MHARGPDGCAGGAISTRNLLSGRFRLLQSSSKSAHCIHSHIRLQFYNSLSCVPLCFRACTWNERQRSGAASEVLVATEEHH